MENEALGFGLGAPAALGPRLADPGPRGRAPVPSPDAPIQPICLRYLLISLLEIISPPISASPSHGAAFWGGSGRLIRPLPGCLVFFSFSEILIFPDFLLLNPDFLGNFSKSCDAILIFDC